MPGDMIEELWDTAVEAAWREIANGVRKRKTRRTKRKTAREKLLEKIEKALRDDDFFEDKPKRSTSRTSRSKKSVSSRSTHRQRSSKTKSRSRKS